MVLHQNLKDLPTNGKNKLKQEVFSLTLSKQNGVLAPSPSQVVVFFFLYVE